MKQELIPQAEDKANFGKLIKTVIREMWSLEYEIAEIQVSYLQNILFKSCDFSSLWLL